MKNALLLLSAFAVLVCVAFSSCGVDSNAATHDIESVAPSAVDTVTTVEFGTQPSITIAPTPELPNAEYTITDGDSEKPALDGDVCCDLMPIEHLKPGLTPENSGCNYKRPTYQATLHKLRYPPSNDSNTRETDGHGHVPINSCRWHRDQLQFNDNCTVDRSTLC